MTANVAIQKDDGMGYINIIKKPGDQKGATIFVVLHKQINK